MDISTTKISLKVQRSKLRLTMQQKSRNALFLTCILKACSLVFLLQITMVTKKEVTSFLLALFFLLMTKRKFLPVIQLQKCRKKLQRQTILLVVFLVYLNSLKHANRKFRQYLLRFLALLSSRKLQKARERLLLKISMDAYLTILFRCQSECLSETVIKLKLAKDFVTELQVLMIFLQFLVKTHCRIILWTRFSLYIAHRVYQLMTNILVLLYARCCVKSKLLL